MNTSQNRYHNLIQPQQQPDRHNTSNVNINSNVDILDLNNTSTTNTAVGTTTDNNNMAGGTVSNNLADNMDMIINIDNIINPSSNTQTITDNNNRHKSKLLTLLHKIQLKQLLIWLFLLLLKIAIYLQYKLRAMPYLQFPTPYTGTNITTHFNIEDFVQQYKFRYKEIMESGEEVRGILEQQLRYSGYDLEYFVTEQEEDDEEGWDGSVQGTGKDLGIQKKQKEKVEERKQYEILYNRIDLQNYLDQNKSYIQINRNSKEIQSTIQQMINYKHKLTNKSINNKSKYKQHAHNLATTSINLTNFFSTLSKFPTKLPYLQAQFHHYNSIYKISNYNTQLPLCITIFSHNSYRTIPKLYKTILQQNYTNYHIVHIDDNSQDYTGNIVLEMIQKKYSGDLGNRVSFVQNKRRKYQLGSRDFGVRGYCRDDEVVVEVDADGFLIGNQVFQLINTLYQVGNMYQGKNNQVWALYLSHIYQCQQCQCILPYIYGQIPQNSKPYRLTNLQRTTQLRTYLKKIYLKIDQKDFIDPLSHNNQLYTQGADKFIHSSIFQLSGRQHTKIIDQFPYFYSISKQNQLRKAFSLEYAYSLAQVQAMTPYLLLQSLESQVKRMENYTVPYLQRMHKKIKMWEIGQKRNNIKKKIRLILDGHSQ